MFIDVQMNVVRPNTNQGRVSVKGSPFRLGIVTIRNPTGTDSYIKNNGKSARPRAHGATKDLQTH